MTNFKKVLKTQQITVQLWQIKYNLCFFYLLNNTNNNLTNNKKIIL